MLAAQEIKVRITISDILDSLAIQHKRNRCACPIHGGSNPTSFSFNDEVYYCHACGAKGNVITLLMTLRNIDYREAVQYLQNTWGVNYTVREWNGGFRRIGGSNPQEVECTEQVELEDELSFMDELSALMSREMQLLRMLRNKSLIKLSVFYAQEQALDHQLEEIDRKRVYLNHNIKTLKRK